MTAAIRTTAVLTCLMATAFAQHARVDESAIQVTLYVDAAHGDDANDGTTLLNATKTIGAAMDKARQNVRNGIPTRVFIGNGTYRESFGTGTDDATLLVIEGEEAGKVIVSGSDVFPASAWTDEGDGVYSLPWTHNWGGGW